MHKIAKPGVVGKALCEAIGLEPEKVSSIVITMLAGSLITVDVTYFADEIMNDGITQWMAETTRHYTLVEGMGQKNEQCL